MEKATVLNKLQMSCEDNFNDVLCSVIYAHLSMPNVLPILLLLSASIYKV